MYITYKGLISLKFNKFIIGLVALILAVTLFAETTNASSSWVSKVNKPQAAFDLGSAVFNGKIYTFGGVNKSAVETYDPSSDTWETKSTMPYQFARGASVVVGSKVYFVGNQLTRSLMYDSLTDSWQIKASMPSYRFWLSAASAGGKIYAFGGTTDTRDSLNSVVMYDPETDIWVSKNAMPTVRFGSSAITYKGKIYVIGGHNGANKTNVVEVYDPVTDSWTTKANMPTPRSHLTLTFFGNKIYAIGGATREVNNNSGFTDVVEIYDPETDTWVTGPAMPSPRGQHVTEVVGNNIYVIGGFLNTELNSVITLGLGETTPDPGNPNPEQPVADRALLTIYISGGQIKEYDLTINELNDFIAWYDSKDAGSGSAKYKFTKTWNKGPFTVRTEYVIFDKILSFDVDEYNATEK
ncbi:kelch repeat-containing protein [Paenibacillus gorillae]|uniref:Kelch repeat-containing protein n=1 Tax=Paenibacillus gorillae TaxID=1243662 RepID=UPI0004B5BE80|nr:kelch repeat-containing protein [Paenibacillus gorillae]